MTFLKTILTSTAVCTALLAAATYFVDEMPEPQIRLTAADLLGSDNRVGEKTSTSGDGLDTFALDRLIGEAAQAGK